MIDSALRFPSIHPEELTTDDTNPGMLHTLALLSPVGGLGYRTSPVSEDSVAELSGSTDINLYPGCGLF